MKRRSRGDGAVARRKDGRWQGQLDLGFVDGRRVRRTVYGRTRREVLDKLEELQQRRRAGVSIMAPWPSLAEYLAHWLELTRARVRPKTVVSYGGLIRKHILPLLGEIPIDELRPQHVERLIAEKSQTKLSPTTVHRVLQVLRSALNDAVRTGLLTRNVAQMVRGPRVMNRPVDFLTTTEARHLIKVSSEHRLGPLIAVALTTGLRQGEVLGLRWKAVDLEVGHITITDTLHRLPGGGYALADPKTARSRRRLVLPTVALRALREEASRQQARRELMADYWERTDFVFTTDFGTPLDPANLRRDFKRLLTVLSVRPIRFHDLRHSAATLLLEQGVHPRIVMEMLGHSQIAVTLNTYSHVMPPLMGEAAKAMDRALDAGDEL